MIEALKAQACSTRRGAGVAAWRRIATAVEAAIEARHDPLDDRLPAEAEIAAIFDVNRHTVRRALASLAERGRVRTVHGRGTFVQDIVLDYPIAERVSFSANLLAQGLEAEYREREVRQDRADAEIARALGIGEGAPVIVAFGTGGTGSVPLVAGTGFYCPERLPGIAERLAAEPSVTKLFASYGYADYRRAWTRLSTRLPTAEEASLLRQAQNQPVMVSESVDVSTEGKPLRYGISVFAGARVHVTIGGDTIRQTEEPR